LFDFNSTGGRAHGDLGCDDGSGILAMFALQRSFKPFSDVLIGALVGDVVGVVGSAVVGTMVSDTDGDSGGGCGGGGGAASAVVCMVAFAEFEILVELANGSCLLLAAPAIADGWVVSQKVFCRVVSDLVIFNCRAGILKSICRVLQDGQRERLNFRHPQRQYANNWSWSCVGRRPSRVIWLLT